MDDSNEDYEDYNNFLKRARQEYGKFYYEDKAKELGVPLVDLTKFTPEAAALACIPYELAQRHNVLPLRKQVSVLWLAMSNPNDVAASDAIRLACRCTVKPVLAEPELIRASIARFYNDQT